MSVPELKVVEVYTVKKKGIQGLMVVIQPTAEMEGEDMIGTAVDFAMPNGQVMESPIEKVFGFEGNLHCFFSRLTKIFKPIGFSDPNEPNTVSFDTNSIA